MSDKKKIKIAVETKEVDSAKKELKKTDAAKKHKKKGHDLIKEMEAKLKAAQEESKETYDRFLRVSAEFENYKKRSSREMDEFRKFANESLIKEMLSVVDNLERAINSSNDAKQANSGLVEGVDITLKEILKIFEKFNVKPVESLKKRFDPNFHQAVMTEETDDYTEHTVINELQKGYMMHDRLLRPAMVVVSMPKVKSNDEKSSTIKNKNDKIN
ncbi:MAG: nucleotide exchange factor GrpE [Desulfobacteraceae bacterium]|uniref:Protein GrpE n=1 Tax=Candidatus Desulfaltia bathyphila TaxID=2841697 RepID=A0A8J6N315_9BACT|nr:nucleotide exchange factor GrpE [Candidatus Desulfaltia bathyphila]MBL7196304.1 nucleotide exchange factor GrpE [Desulfobacterales bacterium]